MKKKNVYIKFDMPHLYTSITKDSLSCTCIHPHTNTHIYPHIQSLIPPPMLLSKIKRKSQLLKNIDHLSCCTHTKCFLFYILLS